MEIDKKTYKIDRDNYFVTKHKKHQIILAGSLRKNNYHIKRLKIKDFGRTKKWPTFSISREGKIYQHYDPKYYTNFMGDKVTDKQSISVVLENMGMVFFDYEANKFLNNLHEVCSEDKIHERNFRSYSYCETYTDEQYNSTLWLCMYLCEEFNIPKDSIGHNVYYEDTPTFKGVVTRSNFDKEYLDLNPSFNFREFLREINEEEIND